MKISNPLLNEQKRHRRNGMVLLLVLGFSMALLDYLVALSDRLDLRQTQLNAATSDLDHQLLPLLHLANVMQAQASQALQQAPENAGLADNTGLAAHAGLNGGQLTPLRPVDKSQQVRPLMEAETAMLQQLQPWFRQQLKSTPYLLNLSYISEGLQWFHLTEADASAVELANVALQQIAALVHIQLNTNAANLLVLDELKQRYALHIPVRQDKNLVGHLLLEIDLLAMLQQVKISQHSATLILMDKVGKVLLAVQDGHLANPSSYDGSDQNDSLQHLALLPFVLHIQPDAVRDTKAELTRFAGEVVLYMAPLLVLYLYMLSRFKRKVLRPFSRLLIHVARLERGDVQGVRHVPLEWEAVFKQTEQLRDRGTEKFVD